MKYKKILLFCLGLFLILSGLSIAVKPKDHDVYNLTNYVRTLENVNMEKEHTMDVLFVGDSEASDGFSPLQFWGEHGISSYNISNPAQLMCDSYALIDETLKKQDVKVIVMEPSCFFFDASLYSSDPYLQAAERIFPIVHYHQVYRMIKPKKVDFGNVSTDTTYKGFWLKTVEHPFVPKENYMGSPDSAPHGIPAESVNYFGKIVELCREKQVEILFVSIPMPAYWDYSMHNAILNCADQYGIDYIDLNLMNDELGMDWAHDSSDGGVHLSLPGTIKVCSYLGEILMDRYSLTDHRNDPMYDSWQNAYDVTGIYKAVKS